MIRVNDKMFLICETGDWLFCGIVHMGVDGEYVEWLD